MKGLKKRRSRQRLTSRIYSSPVRWQDLDEDAPKKPGRKPQVKGWSSAFESNRRRH
jgi:hypothetical protein